jgi:glycosyltransferase involved in cell wall biosynthesis
LILNGRRIFFVLGNLELGGAERQALILARYLVEHEQAAVQVWGFNKSGPVAEICDRYSIPWRVIPFRFTPSLASNLRSLVNVCRSLREAKPDILLPYTFAPNVVCGLIWKQTGARGCVWNQRDEGLVPFESRATRWAAQRTPRFIANSESGARFLTDQLGVNADRVNVIRNGIDHDAPQSDRRAWRERIGIEERSFVACMVANVHANKDHATLLRAWRKVVGEMETQGRAAVLVLAGRHDGAYESVVALANELGIKDSIRFPGHVSDVAGLLGAVDVSVFSSRSEGCPNAVLESMAANLAVAGTDIDGIREVVGPAGREFLAPAGDSDALAATLVKLANNPDLCARAGAANRTRIEAEFNPRRMCEETVAVLANIHDNTF